MSELLLLASDYLERMANPIYGSAMNEDYAIRFATLMRSEGFEEKLNREISETKDRSTLTSHGWQWVLGWAKSRRLDLSEQLLIELFEEWSSVFLRSDIIDLAIQNSDYTGYYQGSLNEFPNSFLAKIMSRATRPLDEVRDSEQVGRELREEKLTAERYSSTSIAESTLIALLQVGQPITLDAASVLLRHPWHGQQQLLRYFSAILNGFDSETREAWTKRLDPPLNA